jgi:hypothetical protein
LTLLNTLTWLQLLQSSKGLKKYCLNELSLFNYPPRS